MLPGFGCWQGPFTHPAHGGSGGSCGTQPWLWSGGGCCPPSWALQIATSSSHCNTHSTHSHPPGPLLTPPHSRSICPKNAVLKRAATQSGNAPTAPQGSGNRHSPGKARARSRDAVPAAPPLAEGSPGVSLACLASLSGTQLGESPLPDQ